MVQHNLQQELNLQLKLGPKVLESTAGVIADGHMQPEEWIHTTQGEILKVDGCTHGDDHFLPGPTDIAWDLAGATVEWDLAAEARDLLVGSFHRLSGDNPAKRLPAFVIAYAVFRLAYCKMALLALPDSPEEARWHKAYQFYLKRVSRELRSENLKQGVAI
jgi:hypothetical protein